MQAVRMMMVTACAAVASCRSAPRVPGSAFSSASVLAPATPAEEAHDALLRADLSRADSAGRLGFVAGQGTLFADDVVYLRGGLPLVRGRTAALAIAAAESLGESPVRWQPVRAEASGDRHSGFSYGYTIYGAAGATAPGLRIDRYIAFWRREAMGWRIVAYAETYGAPPSTLALPAAARGGVIPDEPMRATTGALDAIRDADVEFSRAAAAEGTGRAFGRFAASDAQVFSAPGEFITGPEAIMQSFGARAGGSTLSWHPVAGGVSSAGDLGFTVGNAESTTTHATGAPLVAYSKYLTVWRRQRDGRWRYVVDGGSARPAG